jgi:hypothetical protein
VGDIFHSLIFSESGANKIRVENEESQEPKTKKGPAGTKKKSSMAKDFRRQKENSIKKESNSTLWYARTFSHDESVAAKAKLCGERQNKECCQIFRIGYSLSSSNLIIWEYLAGYAISQQLVRPFIAQVILRH